MDGHDTIGLLPTGGGKSITFQIPALALHGLCLVVSPLIALMEDQIRHANQLGIKATTIHSALPYEEVYARLTDCTKGLYKLLYVSPERLQTPFFLSLLSSLKVSLLVVDEAHCISHWGYDFRPSYLKIATIRTALPHVPIMALTATAPKTIVEDIKQKLKLVKPHVFRASFVRPNLTFVVRQVNYPLRELFHILKNVAGSTIIYTRSRRNTTDLCQALNDQAISALSYHAGLEAEERSRRQKVWTSNQVRVMVATNAFGMGIDKSDVRMVIHFEIPPSLEDYYQEAGRAGRDGKKAYAILLHAPLDSELLLTKVKRQFPPIKEIEYIYRTLLVFLNANSMKDNHQVYAFKLSDFCTPSALSVHDTHYALKLLHHAEWLVYIEEENGLSKVIFNYPLKDKASFPKVVYQYWKTKKMTLAKQAVAYAENKKVCRASFLLNYLEEENPSDCGICDLCLSHLKKTKATTECSLEEIRNALLIELRQSPRSLTYLIENLPFPKKQIINTLRILSDQDPSIHLKGDTIALQIES